MPAYLSALVALLALTALVSAQEDSSGLDAGAYLAAEQAFEVGEYALAAEFYARALPDSKEPFIVWRRLVSLLNSGRLSEAAEQAERLEALGYSDDTTFFVRSFAAAHLGDWQALLDLSQSSLPSSSYAGLAAPYLQMIALHAQGKDDAAYALLDSASLPSADLARLTAALLRIQADAPFAHSDGAPSLAKIDAQLAVLLARHAWRHDQGMRAQALYRELLQAGINNAYNRMAAYEYGLLDESGTLDDLTAERPTLAGASHEQVFAEFLTIFARWLSMEPQSGLDMGQNIVTHLLLGAVALHPRHDIAPRLLAEQLVAVAVADQESGLNAKAYARQATRFLQAADLHPAERLPALLYEVRITAQFLSEDTALERLRQQAEVYEVYGETLEWRLQEAELLAMTGDYDEAVARYPSLIERMREREDSRLWLAEFRLGIAFHQLDRQAEAEVALGASIAADSEQPVTLNYLAYLWIDQGVKLDEAEAMLVRVIELEPDVAAYVDSLGWLYYRQGDFARALPVLERAALLDAEDGDGQIYWDILDHLGDTYWQLDRVRDARFMWRRALSFLPDDEDPSPIEAKLNGEPPRQLP
jgi:tetratricopeptide (TPR) repeat protein